MLGNSFAETIVGTDAIQIGVDQQELAVGLNGPIRAASLGILKQVSVVVTCLQADFHLRNVAEFHQPHVVPVELDGADRNAFPADGFVAH